MLVLDYKDAGDDFIVHIGGSLNEVDVHTFANTLVPLARAIELVHGQVQPFEPLEISIDAIGGGSFRFRLNPKTKKLLQQASVGISKDVKSVLLMVMAATIAAKIASSDPDTKVEINGDVTIIENQNINITIPTKVYEYQNELENNEELDQCISDTFKVLLRDEKVENFGLTTSMDDVEPLMKIEKKYFPRLCLPSVKEEDDGKRVKHERTELIILRAWLDRGNRRWQFIWGAAKISAPIHDDDFYAKMEDHKILFGSGDSLDVDLRINQIWNKQAQIWFNDSFVVERVYNHTEGPHQPSLLD